MNPITQELARKLLFQSDAKYISQEQPAIFYDNFSGDYELETYTCNECLIVKSNSDWFIHPLSDKADIVAAQNDIQMLRSENDSIYAFSYGAPPENLKYQIGSHKFARKGSHYEDPDIRKITLEDKEKAEIFCENDPDDNMIGRDLVSDFLRNFHDFCTAENYCTLGLFNSGELVGYAQGEIYKELDMITVNIFVKRAHRRKGYAKRLLSALCATQQEAVYCYSCVSTNEASAATAKSCGFRYMGSYIKLE